MTRIRAILAVAIAVELGVGGFLVTQRLGRAGPPLADRSGLDPVSSEEIGALAAHCETTEQWRQLGETYLALGFYPEAEACLRQASQLDPINSDLAFKHAFALERIGKIEDANGKYEAAVRSRHPRPADCWYYIGRNHLRLERPQPAVEAFTKAEVLPAARYELALLAARSGRASEAEQSASALAREFPASYTPVSLQYRLALAQDDGSRADIRADEFVHRPQPLPSPFDTEVNWIFETANSIGRDRLFRDAGREMQARRVASAEQLLSESLQAAWHPDVADRLAEVRFVLGRPDEAAKLFSEAIERAGPSFQLLWRLGQVHAALGDQSRAVELWDRASRLATGPEGRGLWQDLAAHYQKAGDTGRANNYSAKADLAEGMELLGERQPSSALAALARAVKSNPNLAHAWFYVGEAHRAMGRASDARTAYQKCLTLDPNHGRVRRALQLPDE